MGASTAETIISLLPITIVGAIHAGVALVMARKQSVNPWGWSVRTRG